MKLKDKKIKIIGYVEFENELGEIDYTLAPIHEGSLWAYYRQLSGNEKMIATMTQSMETALFIVNWRDDIKTDMKIEYKGNNYDIVRIDDFEGYKQDIKLYCKIIEK